MVGTSVRRALPWRHEFMTPGAVLRGVVALTALVAASSLVAGPGAGLVLDNLQELVATIGAAIVIALVGHARRGRARVLPAIVVVALASAALGQLAWDIGTDDTSRLIGTVLMLVGALAASASALSALYRGLDRRRLAGIAVDGLILFLTGSALAVAIIGAGPEGVQGWSGLVGDVLLLAVAGSGALALVARRSRPSFTGPWALRGGVVLAGLSWAMWRTEPGTTTSIAPSDFLYSAGMLLAARGMATWQTDASSSPRADRFGQMLESSIPSVAVALAAILAVLPTSAATANAIRSIVGAVIITSALRQVMLHAAQQRAQDAERRATRRLADLMRERLEVIASLDAIGTSGSPEEAAWRICEEALRLDGVDHAIVRILTRHNEVVPFAVVGLAGALADFIGQTLPPDRAAAIVARAAAGPWVDRLVRADDPLSRRLWDAGLRGTANAPILRDGRVLGVIGFATRSADVAAALTDRLPTVRQFAVVAAGLLGPALEERDRRAAAREAIQAIIDGEAFVPVFQPILPIEGGRPIGFEALTRFADGMRPDHRFAEAARVGMGEALEAACLDAAVRAARLLPADAWLSLNASPTFAANALGLLAVVAASDHPVVIEITEHVEVEDYGCVVAALRTLGGDVRVSVDDAGAGYAGLTHILQLRPDFVKLDIALVRSIDTDRARQAMVRSMVWFAQQTGSVLIAEGIETAAERAALSLLGVKLGQGYLLGRPAPAVSWATDLAA